MKYLGRALIYLGFFALVGFAVYFTGDPRVLLILLILLFVDL